MLLLQKLQVYKQGVRTRGLGEKRVFSAGPGSADSHPKAEPRGLRGHRVFHTLTARLKKSSLSLSCG